MSVACMGKDTSDRLAGAGVEAAGKAPADIVRPSGRGRE
jgi:hypothetical protein